MKPAGIVGIILIAVGIFALVLSVRPDLYERYGYTVTERQKVIDAGPLQITSGREKRKPLPAMLPPTVACLALAGGVALLIAGNKKS
jgi:hypothetical protein